MGSHWLELTILGFLVGFSVIGGLWMLWNSSLRGFRARPLGYKKLLYPRNRHVKNSMDKRELVAV